ncbi:uncharacterized protein TA15615 [Theileria annulata]|uniref:Uncharacterized protein n=1 Tax=Theileria annulata TaxID=5874 RepID=Q4UFL0_THEAN|nr:uncharacterized protein TA15615 [Theileria annulata]CAI74106.1 hypothetical protein TA15615 [Theileria annulata]|eukprot:XP_951838.1 hypothetical protein TA15615 [Theileria annulata]
MNKRKLDKSNLIKKLKIIKSNNINPTNINNNINNKLSNEFQGALKFIPQQLLVNCYKINIENIIFKNKFINFKITHKNSSIHENINKINKINNFNNLNKNVNNLANKNNFLKNLDNDRLKILLPNTLILKKKFDNSYPILSIDFGNRIGLSFNYFNEIELFNIKFTNYQQTTQEIIKIINYIKYKFIIHQIFILLGFPFIPNLYHTEWDVLGNIIERDVERDIVERDVESDVLGNRKYVYTDLRLLYQILFTLDFGLYLAYYVNTVTGSPVTGSGPTGTPTGKRANNTFSTMGKGANFTAIECTMGKGANSMPMECTSERELTTAMECTTKDIGAVGASTVTDVTENFITKCIYCKLFGNKKCIFGGNCTSEHFTTYQISLFNFPNTVLGQADSNGPKVSSSTTGTIGASTVTPGKRANYTFNTLGKGANFTAMECTPGKGANFMGMECTPGKRDNNCTPGRRANDTFNTMGKGANFMGTECTMGKRANFMGTECTMGKRANFMGTECITSKGDPFRGGRGPDTVTGNKDNKSSINIYKNLMNIKENFIILPNKNNIFNNTRSNNILLYQNIKNKLIKSIQ